MQSDPNQENIEGLKAAGEELKNVSPPKFPDLEKSWEGDLLKIGKKKGKLASGTTEEIDFLKKIQDYQKELSQEQSILEKTLQEVKESEKKLEERIELLKKLQVKSTEINKELKEFQEQLALAKKENSSLLGQIKDKLGKENE